MSKIEELEQALLAEQDTLKKALIKSTLAWELRTPNETRSIQLANEALQESKELNYETGLGYSLLSIAYYNYNKNSEFELAFQQANEARELFEKNADSQGIVAALMLIGNGNYRNGNYIIALEYFFGCLHKMDEINDVAKKAAIMNNIGTVYNSLGDYTNGLKYLSMALTGYKESGDRRGESLALNNIGIIHSIKKDYLQAMPNYFLSLEIGKELNNRSLQFKAMSNLGFCFIQTNELEKAKKQFSEIIEGLPKYEVSEDMANSLFGLGSVFVKEKKIEQALEILNEALEITEKIKSKKNIYEIHEELSKAYKEKGDFQKALEHNIIFHEMKDELFNMESSTKIKNLELNNIVKAEELNRLRNVELKKAHDEIAENQKQLLDSIRYAKQIQDSILISEEEIKKDLPDIFILYLPKDIVSGDFYWFSKHGNESIIVAADCTGHGVPGAFLSMIGSTLLNEIVNHKKITDPSVIIKTLAESISSTLINKGGDAFSKDGMDISICKINHATNKLYFAAVNQSIYLVDKKNVKKVDAPIRSFNGIFAMNKEEVFGNVELDLEKNTMIYMSTDGYTDQRGEQTNKKFYASLFENLLNKIYSLPTDEQKTVLEKTFYDWKGPIKQIDDILVIGLKT